MKENYLMRYSVDVGGHIVAVFNTEEEAREFVADRWWLSMATIYDHEQNRDIMTLIRL